VEERPDLGAQLLGGEGSQEIGVGTGLETGEACRRAGIVEDHQDGQVDVIGTRTQPGAPRQALLLIAARFEDGETVAGQVVGVGLAEAVAVDLVTVLVQESAHLLDSVGILSTEKNPGRLVRFS
jgi:hypothetical protein